MNKKIFISTGEVSGDLHGSLLSKALLEEAKKKSIGLEICGLGGERMNKEGVKILQDTTSISAIGIWEALPLIIPTIIIQRRFYKLLKKYIILKMKYLILLSLLFLMNSKSHH